ncbi:MAG: type II toxin-antitoxin system prevent-host-death family antitoxin [Thermoleophilia bacterium]|nr:type II toxin-antitoxin system prevent-host-death family antitoxin [Thermoleophilia bacterium]
MDVGITDLKDNLSQHLKSVREGDVITVTNRGKPIARIKPVDHVLDQMIADGRVTPAKEPTVSLPEPVKGEGSIFDQRR